MYVWSQPGFQDAQLPRKGAWLLVSRTLGCPPGSSAPDLDPPHGRSVCKARSQSCSLPLPWPFLSLFLPVALLYWYKHVCLSVYAAD